MHGHHYALVLHRALRPNSRHEYRVRLDGQDVWPPADSEFPPSVIRTPDPEAPFRLAFGSCRRSAPFDHEHLEELGADALVALAERMVTTPEDEWPELLLLLGDQVYADDPSDEIVARLREAHASNTQRDPDVRDEIQNFEEYTWLYHEAWTPPPCAGCCRPCRAGCCSTTTTCATTGTRRSPGAGGRRRRLGGRSG